jgi:hypothetical protein
MNKRQIKERRRAERRRRQRVRRRDRLRRQAARDFANRPRWWHEGLDETPTEEIVATLATLGIETDEAIFRNQAVAHGSVDALAEAWLTQSTAKGFWEDYPWNAALTLWSRWAPDLFSIEVFVDKHLPLDAFLGKGIVRPEEAQHHWSMAQAVMNLVVPKTGLARPELLEQLSDESSIDIKWWLGELPFSLARFGLVDEAVEVCARMAPLYEAQNFLGDRAVILAQAGRREEALRQVAENLSRYPNDAWICLNAGHVQKELGDLAAAEANYRRALAITNDHGPSHERDEALDRLVRLLHETGRVEEADTLEDAVAGRDPDVREAWVRSEASPALDSSPWTVPREGARFGRNEPCPCGSGRKFKRCCGR